MIKKGRDESLGALKKQADRHWTEMEKAQSALERVRVQLSVEARKAKEDADAEISKLREIHDNELTVFQEELAESQRSLRDYEVIMDRLNLQLSRNPS